MTALLSPVLTTTKKVTKETRMCTLTQPPTHTYTGDTHTKILKNTYTKTLTRINLVKFSITYPGYTHTKTHTHSHLHIHRTHTATLAYSFSLAHTHTHTKIHANVQKVEDNL